MSDESRSPAAVYVSWVTFKRAIETLAQGIPNRVDRSAFPGMAWGVQAQLLTGMRFLGLIDDDGKPTPTLDALAVPDEVARKEKLKAILRERYSDLFALDLMKATPAQLDEQMGNSYNVAGATRQKATRFFLGAVDYVGIPVSRLFKPKSNNGATPPRRRRAAARVKAGAASELETPASDIPATTSGGTARVVKLKSGGTLTVSASIDLFSLMPSDRKFVFELIDKLEEYERTNQPDAER